MNKWVFSDAEKTGSYLGSVEFEVAEDWHFFEVFVTPERIVFGGMCNVGFLESGYMVRDTDFSIDENVSNCLELLEDFYTYGTQSDLYLTQRV